MYDLRRLRAFHAVAETGSFSHAALELGYAQSVVSHHVAALEREFGLTLVNRGTRPVSVTDAGDRLLSHARSVLGQVAAAEDELRAVAGLQSGTLRVGAFFTACNSFVPAALARFAAAHPKVEIELTQLEEPEALRHLRSGDLDLAVVWRVWEPAGKTDRPDHKDGFEQIQIAEDPYRVVLPPSHSLCRRRELRLADLASEQFNGPPAEGYSLAYRTMLDRLCAEAGFEPDVAYVVQDITVGRAFTAAGLGVALMSELGVPEPRADVEVRPVRDIHPYRSVYATWLGGRKVPAVAHMVEYIAEAAKARLG